MRYSSKNQLYYAIERLSYRYGAINFNLSGTNADVWWISFKKTNPLDGFSQDIFIVVPFDNIAMMIKKIEEHL